MHLKQGKIQELERTVYPVRMSYLNSLLLSVFPTLAIRI